MNSNQLKIFRSLKVRFFIFFSLCFGFSFAQTPNILLIISDDVGVDVSNGYHQGALMPNTPTLDSLRDSGILFDNVWATPKCTPTRAAIMSGKYGVKTGVTRSPGNLDLSHTSIFKAIEEGTNRLYSDALIGKWHISSPADPLAPLNHGADYFMGILPAQVDDYFQWDKTEAGTTNSVDSYVTSTLTDTAISWINQQSQPWFLWLAHVAPHSPFHEPPQEMYSIPATGSNFRKYIAMIESVDFEINRLLNAIPEPVRSNTIIIYIGDNGTPSSFVQDYPAGRGKSTLYQGGIRVPMIISGKGVSRKGEREESLIHAADLYATIIEMAGIELSNGIYNSLSFHHLLNNEQGATRNYNYSELSDANNGGWTIRSKEYKLINFSNGSQEFYNLLSDSLEVNDLMAIGLNPDQQSIKADLESEAEKIRDSWSCRDFIQNGNETGIDCGGNSCTPCQVTDTDEISLPNAFKVYPNPASHILTIEKQDIQSQSDYIVRISTILGQSLQTENIPQGQDKIQIDLASIAPQMLIVNIFPNTGTEILEPFHYTFKVSILRD